MKTLLFSVLLLSGADVVVLLATVGQTRFLAETIGPAGFGVYSLLQAFFRVFGTLGDTWMSVSATRWIFSDIGRGDAEGAKQVLSVKIDERILSSSHTSCSFSFSRNRWLSHATVLQRVG